MRSPHPPSVGEAHQRAPERFSAFAAAVRAWLERLSE
jgi:hypothetical protein